MTATVDTPYEYWDQVVLIDHFDSKSQDSFFKSETALLKKINIASLNSVLDIGCSCGRFYDLLSALGYPSAFSGIDISQQSIARCAINYPAADLIWGNALDYDFNRRFDLVNATGVMQHEAAFGELMHKMVALSQRYVLFDIKLANVSKYLFDIEQAYCQLNNQRIPIICMSYQELIQTLSQIKGVGAVYLFGYETPFNQQTVLPRSLDKWASVGVLIERGDAFDLRAEVIPEFIIKSCG